MATCDIPAVPNNRTVLDAFQVENRRELPTLQGHRKWLFLNKGTIGFPPPLESEFAYEAYISSLGERRI